MMVQKGRDFVALREYGDYQWPALWDSKGFIRAREVRCICFTFYLFSSKSLIKYILLYIFSYKERVWHLQTITKTLSVVCFTWTILFQFTR